MHSDKIIDNKGKKERVLDLLTKKNWLPSEIDASNLEEYNNPPLFASTTILERKIVSAAKKLRGLGSLSSLEAFQIRR